MLTIEIYCYLPSWIHRVFKKSFGYIWADWTSFYLQLLTIKNNINSSFFQRGFNTIIIIQSHRGSTSSWGLHQYKYKSQTQPSHPALICLVLFVMPAYFLKSLHNGAEWNFFRVAKSRVFYVILANHRAFNQLSSIFSRMGTRVFPANEFLRNEKPRAWTKQKSYPTYWIQLGKQIKLGVLKNFSIFTGKYLCRSLFLIKSQA